MDWCDREAWNSSWLKLHVLRACGIAIPFRAPLHCTPLLMILESSRVFFSSAAGVIIEPASTRRFTRPYCINSAITTNTIRTAVISPCILLVTIVWLYLMCMRPSLMIHVSGSVCHLLSVSRPYRYQNCQHAVFLSIIYLVSLPTTS